MSANHTNKVTVNFINVTMKNINNITDDIHESLMDEDYTVLNLKIKEINSIFRELQKLSENEI